MVKHVVDSTKIRVHLISLQFFFSKRNAFQIGFTPSLPLLSERLIAHFLAMKLFTRFCCNTSTAWCSETGSLTSLDACNSGASSDVREPISLHQAVHVCIAWSFVQRIGRLWKRWAYWYAYTYIERDPQRAGERERVMFLFLARFQRDSNQICQCVCACVFSSCLENTPCPLFWEGDGGQMTSQGSYCCNRRPVNTLQTRGVSQSWFIFLLLKN